MKNTDMESVYQPSVITNGSYPPDV